MHPILHVAVANTCVAAILALIAWIAGKAFRRPALTHGLWLLVLVKLVTPPIWSIPLKLAKPAVAKSFQVTVRNEPKSPRANFIETVRDEAAPTTPRRVAPDSDWLPAAALATWAAGSVVCAAVAVSRLRRFARLLRCAAPAPPDVRDRADRLAVRIGLGGSPVVYFLPAGVSPMLFGLGRGLRLLVPQRLWEKLDDDERSSLLLHELAHLRRRDHWVRGFELMVTIVYWWNPLAWWARRELRAAEELCCDAWVTWSMPAAADAYARALVEAVDFMCVSRSRPALPAMASGIGAFRHLKRRLVMIQQRQGSRGLGWAGTAGVALAAMVLPLSLTRAQERKASSEPDPAPPTTRPHDRDQEKGLPKEGAEIPREERATRAQLDRNLPECNFDGVALTDVLDFLHDVSGANIFINWKALADAGVD
jgi:bla regulator protein BlaR1